MRFEEIQVTQSGITRSVAVLEWDMSDRGLCERCDDLRADLGLDDEEW